LEGSVNGVIKVLQCIESLLCNDRDISKYTRAASMQRLGKRVPSATVTRTREVLLEPVFSARSVKHDMRKTTGAAKSVLHGGL
jgi:hypothetical protein